MDVQNIIDIAHNNDQIEYNDKRLKQNISDIDILVIAQVLESATKVIQYEAEYQPLLDKLKQLTKGK